MANQPPRKVHKPKFTKAEIFVMVKELETRAEIIIGKHDIKTGSRRKEGVSLTAVTVILREIMMAATVAVHQYHYHVNILSKTSSTASCK